MTTIKIIPAQGRRVRFPDGRLLPAEGAEVEHDLYWTRRIADGDVVVLSMEIAS